MHIHAFLCIYSYVGVRAVPAKGRAGGVCVCVCTSDVFRMKEQTCASPKNSDLLKSDHYPWRNRYSSIVSKSALRATGSAGGPKWAFFAVFPPSLAALNFFATWPIFMLDTAGEREMYIFRIITRKIIFSPFYSFTYTSKELEIINKVQI